MLTAIFYPDGHLQSLLPNPDDWMRLLVTGIFVSYHDVVDHCCFAWNTLADQPWRIMSIGLRKWEHGF